MATIQDATDYEMSRENRIKENRERMQKLGIFDLSLQVKSLKPSPRRNINRKIDQPSYSPIPCASAPTRRSSRLQNSTPVSYCEIPQPKKDKSLKSQNLLREEGAKPEIYTEEHKELLGSTEVEWTLFIDGYGKDGKRIYDPIKGKTCHQCRQKTLGQRTHCWKCNLVQGQFCGDCLYMRYGENVLEANANPEWICPVCRGICNCSLCRQAKGWAPTGPLYKKISSLGYKSVAHFLVQTRLTSTVSDETNVRTKTPSSAKRSLPFSDIDDVSNGDGNNPFESNPEEAAKDEKDEKFSVPIGESVTPHPLLKDESKQFSTPEKVQNTSACDEKIASTCEVLGEEGNGSKETTELDEQDSAAQEQSGNSTKSKKRKTFELTNDSIATRLRQRRGKK